MEALRASSTSPGSARGAARRGAEEVAKLPHGLPARVLSAGKKGMPPPPSIPESNRWTRGHAGALQELAEAGSTEGSEACPAWRSNGHKRLLRSCRDACLHALAAAGATQAAA